MRKKPFLLHIVLLAKTISVRADSVIDTWDWDRLGLEQIIWKESDLGLAPFWINTQVIRSVSRGGHGHGHGLHCFGVLPLCSPYVRAKIQLIMPNLAKQVSTPCQKKWDMELEIQRTGLRKSPISYWENRANALQKNTGSYSLPRVNKGVKWFRRVEKIKCCKVESQHYQIVEDTKRRKE